MAKAMSEKSYGACCIAPTPASQSSPSGMKGSARGNKRFSIEIHVRALASARPRPTVTRQSRTVRRMLARTVLAAQFRWVVQLMRSCHPLWPVVE
jgi:hypothetical protein